MRATQLEIFKATIQHEYHEDYLFYANFTPETENRIRERLRIDKSIDIRKYLGMYSPIDVNLKPPLIKKAKDFSKYYKDMSIPKEAFINDLGILEIPGSMYHFTRYVSPLRNATTIGEIIDFPFPSVDDYTEYHMKDEVENAHREGNVTCCWLTHMYEDSWQIRGYTQFLTDMIDNPEICEYILDKITERNIKRAVAAANAGVDVLISGDDVANQRNLMFSPELWRRFIKSRWARVYQAAKSIKPDIQIWYHSDGNIEPIIPELIEIGVTILNPVQPECLNLLSVKQKYGKRLVLDGTIGTQSTMPFGTSDDVKKVIKDRKVSLGCDGALILSPTHVIEPEVPIENIIAFIEECRGRMI